MKSPGLRTSRRISHVFAIDAPAYPRPLFITDAAVNIFPDLTDKRDIVQNAIDLVTALGIITPRVAILSAVETVSPDIRSTIDAAAPCKMADRGQIVGGILDGPLGFDNAVSLEAARTKGIVSPVEGQADILVVPDLEAGNMLAKQLVYLADAEMAGIVLDARVSDHADEPCRQHPRPARVVRDRADPLAEPAGPAGAAQILIEGHQNARKHSPGSGNASRTDIEKASCNARQIAEAQRLAREWKRTEWHCHGARGLRRSCWPGGYLTYIITTRRITSGELLKYRNGLLNGRQTATTIPGVDDVRSRVRAACKWPPRAKTAAPAK